MGLKGYGFVLVGGSGRRLGRDKARLVFEGHSLAARTADLLEGLGLRSYIVGRMDQQASRWPAPFLVDSRPDSGPLSGVHAGLRRSEGAPCYFLPCDMPLIKAPLFERIALEVTKFDVVLPRDHSGQVHFLCGFYSVACLPVIEHLFDCNDFRVESVFEASSLRALILDPEDHQLSPRCFLNINRPADLKRLDQT